MTQISVNQFRDNLKHYAELAIHNHEVIEVVRRNGQDIVVMSAEDWRSIEETLFVLQNIPLMAQIEASVQTHAHHRGRPLSPEEADALDRF